MNKFGSHKRFWLTCVTRPRVGRQAKATRTWGRVGDDFTLVRTAPVDLCGRNPDRRRV